MRPLSVERLESAFRPAMDHRAMIPMSCKEIVAESFPESQALFPSAARLGRINRRIDTR
jgi:hypothetical protein